MQNSVVKNFQTRSDSPTFPYKDRIGFKKTMFKQIHPQPFKA